MVVGLITVCIHMPGLDSLKGKRSIIKSVIGRLKSRFNVSASEVDLNDDRTSAVIGICLVTTDRRFADSQLDTIMNFIRRDGRFNLGRVEREFLL